MNEGLIGILGTVIGSVVGWALTEYSKKGRLVFVLREYKFAVVSQASGGGLWSEPIEQTVPDKNVQLFFKLQVYNTSGIGKIAYNIHFSVADYVFSIENMDTINIDTFKNQEYNLTHFLPRSYSLKDTDTFKIYYYNHQGRKKSKRLLLAGDFAFKGKRTLREILQN